MQTKHRQSGLVHISEILREIVGEWSITNSRQQVEEASKTMDAKREGEIARAAEYLVRTLWRKNVPTIIDKLCRQEEIGYTQADKAIRKAFEPYAVLAEVEELCLRLREAHEALKWCGGSTDFAPGGQAREGWLKIVQPILGAGWGDGDEPAPLPPHLQGYYPYPHPQQGQGQEQEEKEREADRMSDSLDLEAVRARLENISPGPWLDIVTDEGSLVVNLPGYKEGGIYFGDMEETGAEEHANASFIAHSRTDVPALLAEVEQLRRQLGEAQEALEPFAAAWSELWVYLRTSDESISLANTKEFRRAYALLHPQQQGQEGKEGEGDNRG